MSTVQNDLEGSQSSSFPRPPNLPLDVQLLILEQVEDLEDQINCALTCSKWRHFIKTSPACLSNRYDPPIDLDFDILVKYSAHLGLTPRLHKILGYYNAWRLSVGEDRKWYPCRSGFFEDRASAGVFRGDPLVLYPPDKKVDEAKGAERFKIYTGQLIFTIRKQYIMPIPSSMILRPFDTRDDLLTKDPVPVEGVKVGDYMSNLKEMANNEKIVWGVGEYGWHGCNLLQLRWFLSTGIVFGGISLTWKITVVDTEAPA
ncbi:hypothetical protein ABW20_dc0102194 [Dactylellina cionopaga]|nr:hypothetical protein ABW20_dc0102194 [Dactylellina cionopaga]